MTGAELDHGPCVPFFRLRLRKQELWGSESYGVVAEPGDVAFIAGVEQNGSSRFPPVPVSNEVPLLEGSILQEPKMINLWRMKIKYIKIERHKNIIRIL